MEDKNVDDVLLPGFRFHPTDEELIGFYLKRKIQQKSLSIELIKHLDIYKHDPWDLPKLATSGEKEWYFYCPRDRKYKNSVRPNRVTSSGFWKATGTDRPIYSSDDGNCIGLKKSLVFYRGRAGKGIKTDWMMHEFRLPSISEPSPQKKLLDKTIHPNEAWAICRVFKKTNSMAQRALTHSWMSHLPEIGLNCNNDLQYASSLPFNPTTVMFPTADELSGPAKCSPNSMIMNHHVVGELRTSESMEFEGFSISLTQEMQGNNAEEVDLRKTATTNEWGSIGFPFSLASNMADSNNGWKSDFQWESPSCPSEMSTTYSTNNCYTPSN